MSGLTRLRALLAILFLALPLLAQRDLGTLVGTITDPAGAAVPNARVLIVEDATALSYEVQTNNNGEFTRPALKPGTYTVTVEAKGFNKTIQKNVVLTAGDRIGLNLSLKVGDVSTAVDVSAEAPLLQTESTVVGQSLNSRQMSELPLGGTRTFTFLARLSPGVVPAEPGARDALGGGFSANGVRSNGQNNFLLNGVDNNVNVIDFLNQTAFVIGPSVDAIGEMRVMTNGYNAEYGRGAGGVVNVTIKSGTNQIHGTVFHYLQNDVLNANRWENNLRGRGVNPLKQNQFGGTLGGPIVKNRTFIFGDYQGTRIRSAGGTVQNLGFGGFYTVPSLAMRNGDFSELLTTNQIGTDALGRPILQGQIFDPTTTRTVNGQLVRDAFPGNMIPANRFDPAARRLLNLFPTPNSPAARTGTTAAPINNYFINTPGALDQDQGDVRVDHRFSDKDSIFGSLSWSDQYKNSTPPFTGGLDGSNFNGATERNLARNAMISYTRVWSPTVITETRAAFTRLVTSRTSGNPNDNSFQQFGIGGFNPITASNGGLPQISAGRYSQFGANNWLPSNEYNNVWDFIQNLAINKGSHALKFGAEYRPIKFPFFQVPFPRGQLSFGQNETSFPSLANAVNAQGQRVGALNNTTGDEMAAFLLGRISSGDISTTNFVSSEKVAWAFFAQDDWKVTSRLTVNIGLRYELFSPIGERFGRQANFVPETLTLVIPRGKDQDAPLPPNFASTFPQINVQRGQADKYLIPWDKTNFGPRIGLAYNWREKTVFRLGYGIFYGGEENQGGNPNRGLSAPFNFSPNLARPAGVGAFDANPFFTGGFVGGFPSNVFSLPAPISFRALATNFRNSMVHKWNVMIQRELPGQMALEVGYIGNHQAKQLLQPDQNACPNLGTLDATINCNALRPLARINPNIGGLQGTASFGYGNYHALTSKIEKRYSAGLTFTGSYTYGHALANSGTTLSGSNGFAVPDPRNFATAYSSAAWDIRHNFVGSFLYELPFGRGKAFGGTWNRGVDALLGGWQLNGILSLRTGSPYTLRSNACQGVWNACRPDVVPGRDPKNPPPGGRTPDEWFDTRAVTTPAPLTGGNLGLQSNNAPPQRNLDLSLFKEFRFTERWRFQFRAESFNLTNTPQFSTPDNNLQSSNFGRVTSTLAGSERKAQMSVRLLW